MSIISSQSQHFLSTTRVDDMNRVKADLFQKMWNWQLIKGGVGIVAPKRNATSAHLTSWCDLFYTKLSATDYFSLFREKKMPEADLCKVKSETEMDFHFRLILKKIDFCFSE